MTKYFTAADFDAAGQREAARNTYPEGFPTLPEIPGARYFDETFYKLEVENMWKKTWIIAAHASQIPETGDFTIFDKLGLSVIITRDKTGEVRGYHNVCRHRGAPLVLENSGNTKRFTCPYHSWSFNLAGDLVAVPEEFNFGCLKKAERSLIPVRTETWRGFVFINLDENAAPLADHLGSYADMTADFPFESLKVKATAQLEIACNWKAMFDNFLEAYHVSTVHPKTLSPHLNASSMVVSLYKNGHMRMKTKKKIANRITHTTPGKAPEVADPTGIYSSYLTGSQMFPNVALGLDLQGFPILTFWPDGPHKAIMDIKMLGPDGDRDDIPGYWDRLVTETLGIVAEDTALMNRIQTSLEGGYFTGMVLSYTERTIYWYQEELDRRIGIDKIPENLRIQQVLSPYTED